MCAAHGSVFRRSSELQRGEKQKNDRIDASKIADCLRCDFLPECNMACTSIRDRRRTLRYRHLLVRQMVQMKNRVSGLLLETGASHNKERLHQVKYFQELLTDKEVTESIRPLLRLSHETIRRLDKTETALISSLERDPVLAERIKNLKTIPGIGVITALTWALEMDDVSRLRSVKQVISYCGLCGVAAALLSGNLSADPVPVRHPQGSSHGFLALRTLDGKSIATGDATQIVQGDRVTSRVIFP